MKRLIVLSALLACALAGLALWLWLRARSPDDITTGAPVPGVATAPTAPTAPSAPTAPPTLSIPAGGATGSGGTADVATRRPPPRVYAVGDVIIRDHRGPDAPAITEEPVLTPPIGKFLQVATAQRVVTALEGPAKKCLQALPSGPQSLSVTMTVEVKNSSLTVKGVAGAAPGVPDSVVEPTLACLRERMIGARIDAAGEGDVPSYPITTVYSAQ